MVVDKTNHRPAISILKPLKPCGTYSEALKRCAGLRRQLQLEGNQGGQRSRQVVSASTLTDGKVLLFRQLSEVLLNQLIVRTVTALHSSADSRLALYTALSAVFAQRS